MGIKGLTSLINDEAPNAISEHEIKTFFGRKVAIDASMSLYQFLIAVRQQDGQQLMSESGETTSHLMGFFYRTLRMIEHGIKPMYVFDGKPPDLKKQVLAGRFEKRADAKEEEEAEKDTADAERMNQLSRRQVRVTKQHNEEVRELLRLMGIPCVVAPSEAEAQCAELVRAGKVYAVGSEDMDTLTFGATKMLKHLTFSEQKKMPVHEVDLQKVLAGFEMSMDQFIDLCILLGCDYLEKINGIGPKTALKLIREHETLDAVIEHLRIQAEEKANASPKKTKASKATASDKKGKGKAKVEDSDEDSDKEENDEDEKPKVETPAPKRRGGIQIPELWPYKEAKELFKHPDVQKGDDLELKWISPDVEGLVAFLCTDKGFNEDRVRKGAEKLKKALTQKQQGRLDGFFTVTPAAKRKPEDDKKSAKDKKSKTASGSGAKGGKGKGKK